MGDALWSGWGVRTMSERRRRATTRSAYHNGTVWPHDNSLAAWGLARYGRWPEVQRIVQRMLEAARYFDYQLPEVFAGLRRSETPFPIAYPTAARPQAWAAGTPVLLLQLLLGLAAGRQAPLAGDGRTAGAADVGGELAAVRRPRVRPAWDVRLDDGRVRVEET